MDQQLGKKMLLSHLLGASIPAFPQAGNEGWKQCPCAAGSVNSSWSAWVTPSSGILYEATLMSGWKTHFCALPPLKKQIQHFLAVLISPFYFFLKRF